MKIIYFYQTLFRLVVFKLLYLQTHDYCIKTVKTME